MRVHRCFYFRVSYAGEGYCSSRFNYSSHQLVSCLHGNSAPGPQSPTMLYGAAFDVAIAEGLPTLLAGRLLTLPSQSQH